MFGREVLRGYRLRKIGNLIRDLDRMYAGTDDEWLSGYIDEVLTNCAEDDEVQKQAIDGLEGMIATARVILR